MVVELILLVILVIGIVLVGVGMIRYRGPRLPRYTGPGWGDIGEGLVGVAKYGGKGIWAGAKYGGGRSGAYGRNVAESAGESVERFGGSIRAYHHLQELAEMERRGAITSEEAERERRPLTQIYRAGTRGIRGGLGEAQSGLGFGGLGIEDYSEKIYGLSGGQTYHGAGMRLLGLVNIFRRFRRRESE